MRIGINGAFLGAARNGLRTYVQGLMRALVESRRQGDEILAYTSLVSDELVNGGVEYRKTPQLLRATSGTVGNIARFAWVQFGLSNRLINDHVDVCVSLATEGMLWSSVPQVIVVQDLIPLFYPEECPRYAHYFRRVLPHVLDQAVRIVAASEHTKKDLIRHLGVEENKITVIYNGIDSGFYSIENEGRPFQGCPEEFFLFVGRCLPRKNVHTVLRAFARIQTELPHKLVIVAPEEHHTREARNFAARLGLTAKVVWFSSLPPRSLLYLYRKATALLLLSQYEGFGYPPLEAMAVGTPAIVSNTTSLGEVVGGAGVKVAPTDAEETGSSMLRLGTDREYRELLSIQAVTQAVQFRWASAGVKLQTLLGSIG